MNALTNPPIEPARLEIEDISVAYNGTPALQDVTFNIPHGARMAVVGPNGAGKSTLFKALVGLLPLRGGSIRIHGQSLGNHQDCVAYLPQRSEVDWRFPVSVGDVVMMGRFGRMGWVSAPSRHDHAVVQRCLAQMGMADLSGRSISELSGGQQQRVFLARALAQEPHIFLMDEPFTGVDSATQEATLNLLDHLRSQQVTVLISTHDLSLAASRFDSLLLLNRRLLAFGAPQTVLTSENLSLAFGSQILRMADGSLLVDECCPPEDV